MGHLVVMDDSEAQFALTRYSQTLWQELSEELPREVEHDACGLSGSRLIRGNGRGVSEAEVLYGTRCGGRGVGRARVGGSRTEFAPCRVGGFALPDDSVIYPPCAAQFFVDRAVARGAKLFLGQPVEALTRDGVLLRDGSSIAAGLVVNAAGSWSPQLTPGLSVRKRKGHLVITDRYPGFCGIS
jgi:glycine/D-amino acid oxidase-like deaminating enzyme